MAAPVEPREILISNLLKLFPRKRYNATERNSLIPFLSDTRANEYTVLVRDQMVYEKGSRAP